MSNIDSTADKILNDILGIYKIQVQLIKDGKENQCLPSSALNSLHEMGRVLIQFRKESRQSAIMNDLEKIDTEELKALHKDALNILLEDENKKKKK